MARRRPLVPQVRVTVAGPDDVDRTPAHGRTGGLPRLLRGRGADVSGSGGWRDRGWWLVGPVVAAVVAVAAGLVVAGRDDAGTPAASEPSVGARAEPVAVSSDAPRVATLQELVVASDVVVQGRVVETRRGRTFGEPGGRTIVSRLVTLRVDAVLAGARPAAGAVLVEEEGWLDDGSPLVVDGLRPTEEGDAGVWFLAAGGDPDVPAYVVVGPQGRYLAESRRLAGATGGNPLVSDLAALGPDGLAQAVTAAGRRSAP
jgi:hypothetical protein